MEDRLVQMPVAARSKELVCARSLAGVAGSNPAGRHGYLPLVNVVCRQVEVSVTGRSLIQSSPTECVYMILRVIR